MKKITFILAIFIELALLNRVSAENNSGLGIATILLHESAKGFYTNNTISTVANATTMINATTTSNTVIILQVITTSNVTNSSIIIIDYNSTPPNTTSIGILGLNKFFDINVGSGLSSSLGWAIINITYTDSEVTAAGLDENSLRLYHYNTSSGSWEEVSHGGVNNVSNYVWGNLTSFSSFGLGGLKTNGQSCTANVNCSSGHCVHNVCRVSLPYCGDGYCDIGEACSTDCPAATTGGGGGFINTGGCTYNWTCTEWSECIDGVQTRTCTNLGSCFDNKGKPIESQSCIVSPTPSNVTPPTPAPSPTLIPTPTPAVAPTITPAPTTPLGLGIGLIAVIAISIVITAIILKKRRQNKRLIS
jgi:hypothetical protein